MLPVLNFVRQSFYLVQIKDFILLEKVDLGFLVFWIISFAMMLVTLIF